jgi:hypothetical protein
MAAISLFWYTNMAAVTSDENDLFWTCERSRNIKENRQDYEIKTRKKLVLRHPRSKGFASANGTTMLKHMQDNL